MADMTSTATCSFFTAQYPSYLLPLPLSRHFFFSSSHNIYAFLLKEQLFQLKFTAKQLERLSKKAEKEEKDETAKVVKAIKQGNHEGAKIYASNAIRKKNESLNFLRMASRIDAVSSRVQTAVTMKQLSGNMANVVKGMDKAMESMDLEKISKVMEKFEQQFEDLDVKVGIMDQSMGNTVATSTPQDQVDELISKIAEQNNLEITQLPGAANTLPGTKTSNVQLNEMEAKLAALRNP